MAFTKKIVNTDLAPAAVGTYSQGVEHNGVFYFSGQIGIDPKTSVLLEGFEAQLNQIMKNIDGLLESQGIDRTHIIKTSIFVTDLGKFNLVNEAYIKYFQEPYPARSCVEVPNLPKGALVEIEVIAAR
ncbi:putative translational inhibitor protein [Halobacteriovorax marinus SJ]|uniref:Translational inhibitor protein n=1 Tax=Halobacteriovorax marinus (strain ATCC BAA-682 / DSM 15412 / SJ) TaxID=862908 RepID=E1X4H9_HALMS|nr:Rid family detoxifying hydrolase [Halobacteriovorax marinus]CBW25409.1 putative translational inhibitor protein [Halobacteriovorax marinus SJ]